MIIALWVGYSGVERSIELLLLATSCSDNSSAMHMRPAARAGSKIYLSGYWGCRSCSIAQVDAPALNIYHNTVSAGTHVVRYDCGSTVAYP